MADTDCACLYGGCDDPIEFQHVEQRTARKLYQCCECREPIPPGTRYEYFFGRDDGVYTERTCLRCAEIRNALYCKFEGYYFGQLWENIEEQLFDSARGLTIACLEKLTTIEAKQFLQRRWWAWVERRTTDG